jgi:release factor glutamine methyltransferase
LQKNDWTVLEMLNWTIDFFKTKNIQDSRLDAEVLLANILEIKRLDLYLNFEKKKKKREIENFKDLIKKRVSGMPVAYILGEKEFMGLRFVVNENVLIPRPETEILVEEVLKVIKEKMMDIQELTIVDVFTGSGNIPVSLAKFATFQKKLFVYGIDIEEKTLDCAQKNVYLNEVADKVRLFQGDILAPLEIFPLKNKVDIITANPPYIKTKDMDSLQKEVKAEPKRALDGGADGLFFYKKLITQSLNYLKKDGYIFMEIDPELTDDLKKIFLSTNKFDDVVIKKDYQSLDRVMSAKKI